MLCLSRKSRLLLAKNYLIVTLLVCFFSPCHLFAYEAAPRTFVHAMVGAAQFSEDDLTFTETSASDGTTSDNDLSNMPYLGIAFQYPFKGELTQIGLDGSLLFGWRSKDAKVVGGSGKVAVSIDSSLWLADLSAGVFVKHSVNDHWRLYVAAGPAIVFGEYSEDSDEEDLDTATIEKSSSSDSAFGAGFYGRAGVDYQFAPNAYVGVCVRGIKTSLEFDDAPEASSGLSGAQAFVTFSRNF